MANLLRIVAWMLVLAAGLRATASSSAVNETHMLAVPGWPADPAKVDWTKLPVVKSERGTIFRAQPPRAGYNMHGYVAAHGGKFWAMWSSGSEFEDNGGQQVRFATSADGLKWSDSGLIASCDPADGFRYIARGFWLRNGELLALASRDEAWIVKDGAKKKRPLFGPGLQLHYFRLNAQQDGWVHGGVVLDDTINNYEPHLTPNGEWMMSRRDHLKVPSMIVGGVKSISDWRVVPVPAPSDGHEMNEPGWWALPDGRLSMMFRDESKSFRLYRSFSSDGGRSWSSPTPTDFPDGRAKTNILRLRDGRYVLVNNPWPGDARIPLCLSLSTDGVVFTSMRVLLREPTQARFPNFSKRSGYQYPHLIESEGSLFIVYGLNQEDIEILKIRVSDL